ncbi:unnamed protein product [Trichobilharzia regenti]|nr:unnamed protein product [Trichobilharzia regenti]
MIGVVVQSMDFYRIDFNPCPPGLGNPNHFLAGIARCKPTTLCVPLPGFGFKRGGYQCVCQPGHRLPYEQDGPFRGVDIEAATEEEYRNNFDCIPVDSLTFWSRFKDPAVHLMNSIFTSKSKS